MNIINLDSKFSTTRRVTKKQPQIENLFNSKQLQNLLFLPPNPQRKGEGGLRKIGYFKCSGSETKIITSEEKFSDINLLANASTNDHNSLESKFNSSELPLVTIITVVFNGEKYLEQTIQSVINQTYDNVEYIVIDGGSTDSTLDIIRKYNNVIDYWVSEIDNGIYDGMNKGIQLAMGKWINFMNAGDNLSSPHLLDKIKETFVSDFAIIYSDVFIKNKKHTVTQYSRENKNWWKGTPFCHQSAFFLIEKRKFYYDLSYPLAADYDYALRIFSYYSSAKKEKIIIATYDSGGISSQKSFAAALQMYTISKKYYSFSFYMHFYYCLKFLRRLFDFYKK